jgi:hypothetical protein
MEKTKLEQEKKKFLLAQEQITQLVSTLYHIHVYYFVNM